MIMGVPSCKRFAAYNFGVCRNHCEADIDTPSHHGWAEIPLVPSHSQKHECDEGYAEFIGSGSSNDRWLADQPLSVASDYKQQDSCTCSRSWRESSA